MNAEKHNLERIYFSGGFIRGEPGKPWSIASAHIADCI